MHDRTVHFRVLDLRQQPRRQQRTWHRIVAAAFVLGFVATALLFLGHVPFPLAEVARPNVIIFARTETQAHQEFIDALPKELKRSGHIGELQFARFHHEGEDFYQPRETEILDFSTSHGSIEFANELLDIVSKQRAPTIALSIGEVTAHSRSEDDSALSTRSESAANPNDDELLYVGGIFPLGVTSKMARQLLSAGLLCLDVVEPPEAKPRVDILEFSADVPGPAIRVTLAVVNQSPGTPSTRYLRIALVKSVSQKIEAKVNWTQIDEVQHHELASVDDAVDIPIPMRLADERPTLCEVEVRGLDKGDVKRLEIVTSQTHPNVAKPIPQQSDRVLLIPLAAFAKDDPHSTWKKHLKSYFAPGSIFRLSDDQKRLTLGRGHIIPPTPCDIYWPGETREIPDECKKHFVQTAEMTARAASYCQIVIDLCWPIGLPHSATSQFTDASNGLREFLNNDVVALVRRHPTHVLVLGVTSNVYSKDSANEVLAELLKTIGPDPPSFRANPKSSGISLAILADQTESAGNAADLDQARLRTILPFAVDRFAVESKPAEDQSLTAFRRHLASELFSSDDFDEVDISRAVIEFDSKASFITRIAGEIRSWAMHPLFHPSFQGVPDYPEKNSGTENQNGLRDIKNEVEKKTIESIELEEMLEYLIRQSKNMDSLKSTAVLLYDKDDATDGKRAIRVEGTAQLENSNPISESFDGSMLGVSFKHDGSVFFSGIQVPNSDHAELSDSVFNEQALFGGRQRISSLFSAYVAERLRIHKSVATQSDLQKLFNKGPHPIQYNSRLSDDFCVQVSSALQTTTLPTVQLATANTRMVPLVRMKEHPDDQVLVHCGRSENGSVVSIVAIDTGLEQEVHRHSFESISNHFVDWVMPKSLAQSPQHVLQVQALGRTRAGQHFQLEEFSIIGDAMPVKLSPSPTINTTVQPVWYDVTGRFVGTTTAKVVNGIVEVAKPNKSLQGNPRIVAIEISVNSNDYRVIVPAAPFEMSTDDASVSLAINSSVGSMIELLSDLIIDGMKPLRRETSKDLEIPNLATQPRKNAVSHHRHEVSNGIGAGPNRRLQTAHFVVPTKLEFPIHATAKTSDLQVRYLCDWIHTQINAVYVSHSHRGWLLLSALCFIGVTVTRLRETPGSA